MTEKTTSLFFCETNPIEAANSYPDQLVEEAMREALAYLSTAMYVAEPHLYRELLRKREIWAPGQGFEALTDWVLQSAANYEYVVRFARRLFDRYTASNPNARMYSTEPCLKSIEDNLILVSSNLAEGLRPTALPANHAPEQARFLLHSRCAAIHQDELSWRGISPPLWLVKQFYVLCTVQTHRRPELQIMTRTNEALVPHRYPPEMYRRFPSIAEAQRCAVIMAERKEFGVPLAPRMMTDMGELSGETAERVQKI